MWDKYLAAAARALRFTVGSHTIRGGPDLRHPYHRRTAEALRFSLPYCLMPLHGDGNSTMIWLNRDYKPLGIVSDERVNYAEYPGVHVNKNDPRIAALLPYCKKVLADEPGKSAYYLFCVTTSPIHSKANGRRLLALIDKALANPSAPTCPRP